MTHELLNIVSLQVLRFLGGGIERHRFIPEILKGLATGPRHVRAATRHRALVLRRIAMTERKRPDEQLRAARVADHAATPVFPTPWTPPVRSPCFLLIGDVLSAGPPCSAFCCSKAIVC